MAKKTRPSTFKLAVLSSLQFIRLLTWRTIHLHRDRLGREYNIHHGGKTNYSVFRETESRDGTPDLLAVLVVGFRLRFIGSNPLFHWMFQRICIISTPIWSGFHGLRTKLWMVDPESKNYLGIYEWAGDQNALAYAEWLTQILRPLSTRGSVWYEVRSNESLANYLEAHGPTLAVR